MTPIMSLVVLCGLVTSLTVLRWGERSHFEKNELLTVNYWPKISLQLGFCLLASLGVWILDNILWSEWSDQGAVLILLLLEGLVSGLISCSLLYNFSSLHIPKITRSRPTVSNHSKKDKDQEGVIRLRRFSQTRGVLPSGVAVVWNEQRGCWSTLEAAQEDDRNALAS